MDKPYFEQCKVKRYVKSVIYQFHREMKGGGERGIKGGGGVDNFPSSLKRGGGAWSHLRGGLNRGFTVFRNLMKNRKNMQS